MNNTKKLMSIVFKNPYDPALRESNEFKTIREKDIHGYLAGLGELAFKDTVTRQFIAKALDMPIPATCQSLEETARGYLSHKAITTYRENRRDRFQKTLSDNYTSSYVFKRDLAAIKTDKWAFSVCYNIFSSPDSTLARTFTRFLQTIGINVPLEGITAAFCGKNVLMDFEGVNADVVILVRMGKEDHVRFSLWKWVVLDVGQGKWQKECNFTMPGGKLAVLK